MECLLGRDIKEESNFKKKNVTQTIKIMSYILEDLKRLAQII